MDNLWWGVPKYARANDEKWVQKLPEIRLARKNITYIILLSKNKNTILPIGSHTIINQISNCAVILDLQKTVKINLKLQIFKFFHLLSNARNINTKEDINLNKYKWILHLFYSYWKPSKLCIYPNHFQVHFLKCLKQKFWCHASYTQIVAFL